MSAEHDLQRAIATISQSDPIIKLLQQVKLGRMKPGDAGLRAIVEAWIGTYDKTLATSGLTQAALRRIDPAPRLAVLVESGVLTSEHPSLVSLQSTFTRVLAEAPAE